MLSIHILINLKLLITAWYKMKKNQKVCYNWTPFLFYVNMKAATISSLIKEF